jgi:hypothetical protein
MYNDSVVVLVLSCSDVFKTHNRRSAKPFLNQPILLFAISQCYQRNDQALVDHLFLVHHHQLVLEATA